MAKIIGNTTATTIPKPELATYEKGVDISIDGITTWSNPDNVVLTHAGSMDVLEFSSFDTVNIDYQGDAYIVITATLSGSGGWRSFKINIDDVQVHAGTLTDTFIWQGKIEKGIAITATKGQTVAFQIFRGTKYYNGFMTGKQVEKLENTLTKSEIEALLGDAPSTDYTHDLAGIYIEDISLTELQRELSDVDVVVKDKQINLNEFGSAKFYVSGHIRFVTGSNYPVQSPIVKVDGNIIAWKEVSEIDGATLVSYEFDGDVTESIEFIANGSVTIVDLETLEKVEAKDGFMSAEQAEKLKNTFDINIGNGTGENSVQQKLATASGSNSFAEGKGTTASGDNSHVEGRSTNATGYASHAEGNDTTASGDESHAEGGGGTIARGQYSHAEGHKTETGDPNFPEKGLGAHAEGSDTHATADSSHAEGNGTWATNEKAHAEGWDTEASGYASHSEGGKTVAAHAYAHAQGFRTETARNCQTVIGLCNEKDENALFIIGNGELDDDNFSLKTNSNAMTVGQDGNVWIAGDFTVTTPTGEIKVGETLGNIDTVLDNIIDLQNELWGEGV